MGAGATAAASSKLPSDTVPGASKPSGSSLVEGSVQWLLTVVDKEKQEKRWLASKFDEKCAEVNALQEELAALRAQLPPPLDAAGAAATQSRSAPMRGMALAVTEKAQGDVAASREAAGGASAGSSGDAVVGETASTGSRQRDRLKERRGLNLVIAAPGRCPSKDVGAPVSPVPENPSETADWTEDKEVPPEPGSVLLRRRASIPGREDAAAASAEAAKQAGQVAVTKTKSVSDASLGIIADKVFSMDADCPASPKRKKKAEF